MVTDPDWLPTDLEALSQDRQDLQASSARLTRLAEADSKWFRLSELRSWQRRQALRKQAQEHDSVVVPLPSNLSHLQSLPDDILLEIFTSIRGRNQLSCETAGLDVMLPGVALMLICSRWHSLVLSCPMLWCQIDFCISLWDGWRERPELCAAATRLTELLSLVLARSKNHPLDVQLHVSSTGGDPPPSLALLWSTCRRWRIVRMADNTTDLSTLQPSPIPLHLPLLEEALLSVDDRKIQQLAPAAPNLQLAAFESNSWSRPQGPPWHPYSHTLSHLNCVDLHTSAWRDILDVLPCIEFVILRLHFGEPYDSSTSFSLPITVHTLVLDWVIDNSILMNVLRCLQAPSIKYLILKIGIGKRIRGPQEYDGPMELPIHELSHFFSCSGCNLSGFLMSGASIEKQSLDALLQILPVHNVDLEYEFNESGFVETLLVYEGARRFQLVAHSKQGKRTSTYQNRA